MPYMKIKSARTGGKSVDIAPFIEDIKWSENDLDSSKAGRALDGKMYRGKVASKRRADIKLLPVETKVLLYFFPIIRQEYFWFETDMLPVASPVTMEMYNSTRSGGILIVTTDGVVKHKDVSFNIIER